MVAPVTSSNEGDPQSAVSGDGSGDGVGNDSGNADVDMDENMGAAELRAALSPKQKVVLDALMKGVSIPGAADAAQVHRGTVNRWVLKDADFIAARNARLMEHAVENHGKVQAMLPAALATIQEEIENGNARLAMELVKLVMKSQAPLPLSAKVIATQIATAEQEQKLDAEKKSVDLQEAEEQTFARKKQVSVMIYARKQDERPFLERYEDTRRFYHTTLAQGPVTQARMDAIDARVAAEVKRAVHQMMNPGVAKGVAESVAKSPAVVAPAAPNPGTGEKTDKAQ